MLNNNRGARLRSDFRLALIERLLSILLLLTSLAAAQAQFNFTTNNSTITLTGYTGTNADVFIPSMTNGYPVTAIGSLAFNNIPTLISVTVPSSITNFGNYSIYNCTNLLGVYFQGDAPPNSNPAGGIDVLWRDNNSTVYYLQGTKGWSSTFDQLPAVQWDPQVLTQLIYVTNSGTITITAYAGTGASAVIPSTINGLAVTGIGSNAFLNCASLTNIIFPNTVTNIGNFAFASCTSLTSITIPNSVTGSGVFSNCTALANIIIPKNVTSIADSEFSDCTALTSITIPNSVTNIGDWAFQNCYSLAGVYFQGSPPVADSTIFNGDNNVTNYYLPKTAGWGTSFAGRPTVAVLFTYTTNSGAITITKYIGIDTAVVIPSTINGLPVTSIGINAFEVASVTSVIISDSVTSIGVQAFSDCYSLTNVTIGNNVISIGNRAFQNCSSLTSVIIPNNLTTIQEATFVYCTSLTSVTIPNSVTNIEDIAFMDCSSLTNVTIPNSVTSIGEGEFYNSVNLMGIYFQGNAPSFSSDVFDYDNSATIYYLPGTTGWTAMIDGAPTALWNPQANTGDGSFGVHNNQFGFNIIGSSDLIIVVEACTNLANPIWSSVATNILNGGSSYFSDPQWAKYPGRYYRFRSP